MTGKMFALESCSGIRFSFIHMFYDKHTWLFVIVENKNIADGKDRKKPCAPARK